MKESNEREESKKRRKDCGRSDEKNTDFAQRKSGKRRGRNRESLKKLAHGQRDGREKEFGQRTESQKTKMTQIEDASLDELMQELRARPQGLRRAAMAAGEAGYTASQPRAGTATKTPCPNLDEFESYAMWRRSYRFWSAATTLDNKGKAAEIISVLGNKMKNHPLEERITSG